MTAGAARGTAVLAAFVPIALVLTACTSTTSGRGSRATLPSSSSRSSSSAPSSPVAPSSAPASSGRPASCTTYASPDPNRPRMALRFTIGADHRTVTGHERVVFRPDLPITQLVFRLTANTQPTVNEGSQIVVTRASADNGGGAFYVTRANAAIETQGGLLHIPFAHELPAGTVVTATVDFTLTVDGQSFDRFGRVGGFVFFGSGEPLLAWERGFGWHGEDLLSFAAESATSEAMDVALSVTAPAADQVIMSGDPAEPPAHGATRTWRATISTARDVSVAAGPFAVSDTTVEGVHLRVGAPDQAGRDALVPEFRRAIIELAKRFGPFPFPSLSVARLPGESGGIEYPSSILMLGQSRLVAVHETAHQWFYAMVGDSQALHPWLDEAFASYAEELVDHDRPDDHALQVAGPVDASTESYGEDATRYFFLTYNKGAAALFAARQAAGPARFDAAVRCYTAANAWRIANPADLRKALATLPAAIKALHRAGALP